MGEIFDLPPELTIYSAQETREAMLAWVARQTAAGREVLEISASGVQEIDGAGLQLLAALANMEHGWRLVGTSHAFGSACQALGFGHWTDPRHLHHNTPGGAP